MDQAGIFLEGEEPGAPFADARDDLLTDLRTDPSDGCRLVERNFDGGRQRIARSQEGLTHGKRRPEPARAREAEAGHTRQRRPHRGCCFSDRRSVSPILEIAKRDPVDVLEQKEGREVASRLRLSLDDPGHRNLAGEGGQEVALPGARGRVGLEEPEDARRLASGHLHPDAGVGHPIGEGQGGDDVLPGKRALSEPKDRLAVASAA